MPKPQSQLRPCGIRSARSRMEAVHHRVAETTRDEPTIDGERRNEREREREREASPEQDVAESSIHRSRHGEDHDVVDDLHRRDRERFGGERDAGRAKQRHPRTQERYERQAVAEDIREDDPENEARSVPEAEKRRAAEPEHLADAAAREAVDRGLEREARRAPRVVAGVIHPRRSSSTAAYGSSDRSATRATAASRRDSPTRPASSRRSASCRSASTSLRAAARRRSRYSPDSRDQARCLSIASTSCGMPSPDCADVRTIGVFHGRSLASESI